MQRVIPIDRIPCGIIVFNEFSNIISANSSGKEFIEKIKDSMLDLIKDIVSITLHSNTPIEKIIKYSNINDFFVWRIKTELIDYAASEVVVIVKDETMIYQLGQTILKAEKLAVAGHLAIGSLVEIRNPLTIAKGFCQFIENQNAIEMEFIEIILNELKQIQYIIENCTSTVNNLQCSNLELLYKKIWAGIGSHIDSYKLIMVTDNFDNLTINIAEEIVNNILMRLMKILNIWLEENTDIIISVDLLEERKHLNLTIRAYCDVKTDNLGHGNLVSMIKCLETKNNQMELQIINNNNLMVKLQLPIIATQYFGAKSNSLREQVSLSK